MANFNEMNSALLEKMQSRRKSLLYENVGAGWRIVGEQRVFFRSRWEGNYARFLQQQKERGEILEWEHEAEKFHFNLPCGKRFYLPDFRVTKKDGTIVYCEVKGFLDWRSQRKLKWLKRFYPEVKLFVAGAKWFKNNEWRLKLEIKEWESA